MSQTTLLGTQALDISRYYQEVFHVSRSVLAGSEEAEKMTVTSGRKCSALLRSLGRIGSLEKMLLESSIWSSTMCYLTWKIQVTPRGRSVFRLAVSVLHTEEIESSFL